MNLLLKLIFLALLVMRFLVLELPDAESVYIWGQSLGSYKALCVSRIYSASAMMNISSRTFSGKS